MAAAAIINGEQMSLAARDGKVVARKAVVSVGNLRMQFAWCVTVGTDADGGWPAVHVTAVTLETGDRLPRPAVLPMTLSVRHLLRVQPRRVTRHAGGFVQSTVTRNV